jgi:YidC/Oxa1 family membrane protein insertase
MADTKRSSRIWDFLLILAVVYLAVDIGMRWFFPKTEPAEVNQIVLQVKDPTLALGAAPLITVKNNTENPVTIDSRGCLPVTVYRISGSGKTLIEGKPETDCMAWDQTLPAGESDTMNLAPWKFTMFAEKGTYEVELRLGSGSAIADPVTAQFTISEPGFFARIFRAFITKPLLNALIFIASIIPGHDLGLSIIILTLVVKLLLFIPTQQALEGQKKMQMLQPKLEAIRRQYKDDGVKMQQETTKLWKEHKVNPLQSCLPLLVQFPVLIGLFYTIRDGIHLNLARHLIYPFYQDIDWTFDTHWLGFDLTQPFPPLLVALQFIQMKLSFMIADKKKAKQIAETTTPQADTPQEIQQRVMMYALPLLIGFFALKYPSALSIYWGFSTLFAIGQQILVNREHIRP